ncbi:hypothetical protein AB0H36_24000 [Kribbella sp. NPDC050820]|uniref:hypothetical protein n=1 Tax=Kribbella sp. NPDC050820 TaxID=3155408 RepID=UPI0033D92EA9
MKTVTDALAQCDSFKITPKYQTDSASVTARQLPMPGLADGVAIRFDLTFENQTLAQYRAYVVRDSTVLHLDAGGMSDAEFLRFTAKAVAKLDAVVR